MLSRSIFNVLYPSAIFNINLKKVSRPFFRKNFIHQQIKPTHPKKKKKKKKKKNKNKKIKKKKNTKKKKKEEKQSKIIIKKNKNFYN